MVFRSSRGASEEAGQTAGTCSCQANQGSPQTRRYAQEEKGWEEVIGGVLSSDTRKHAPTHTHVRIHTHIHTHTHTHTYTRIHTHAHTAM